MPEPRTMITRWGSDRGVPAVAAEEGRPQHPARTQGP